MVTSTVLIVDDEAVGRDTLEAMLMDQGYNLVLANNGAEALAKAMDTIPDLILLDVMMPDMDGFEVCRRLRTDPLLAEAPVIMVTVLDDRTSRLRGIEAGADDFISKPFDMIELRAKVRTITRLNRYRRLLLERTQRRQAEEALRESEERYRAVSELTSDYAYAFRVEPDGTLVSEWVTEAFVRITGFTPDEAGARGGWASMTHPDDAPIGLRRRQTLLSGQPDVSEFRIVTRSGEVRWLRDYSRPVWDETQGRVVRLIGTAQDITERKRAEESLRRHVERLDTLRRIGLELTSQLDLDTLLHSIVSRAIELLEGASGDLYLYRPERDVLEWAVSIGPRATPVRSILHRGEGFAGQVWETGKPLTVNDYRRWEGRAATYEGDSWTAVVGVPVCWGEEFLGVLNVLADPPRTSSPPDAELLTLFAAQAAAAIVNARLFQQVHTARERLQTLSRRLVEVQEAERRRIARELHDEVGQALTGLKLNLAVLENALPGQSAALHEQVAEIRLLLESTMEEIRGLALELRPAALDDLGLAPALRGYVDGFIRRTGLDVTSDLDETIGRLPERMETALYRIIQETTNNVVRHAAARRVQIILRADDDEVYVCVADDGRGFDPERRLKAATAEGRMGLLGIQERVALLQGRVSVTAAPDKGTKVEIWLPRRRETEK